MAESSNVVKEFFYLDDGELTAEKVLAEERYDNMWYIPNKGISVVYGHSIFNSMDELIIKAEEIIERRRKMMRNIEKNFNKLQNSV